MVGNQNRNAGLRLVIAGRVQGVGFRWFTVQWARDLGLGGYVKNRPDGSVFLEAEGPKPQLETLISEVRKGPSGASVDHVAIEWCEFEHRFRDFTIQY